jgi:hypothetical protein
MKNITLLSSLLFTGFIHLNAQGFIQFGQPLQENQGHRMMLSSDYFYYSAGTEGPRAALYKNDCIGSLSISASYGALPGPAVFWDVIELPDGNLIAAGGATIATVNDTLLRVFLVKTSPSLTQLGSSSFLILNKSAQAKALALAPNGDLLIWGEVSGFSVDFTDAFFQRVNPNTLQPVGDPVVFNQGVDLADYILPTVDGNYLLTGSSFYGNIFNPDAPIDNIIRAYKVDQNGGLLWEATVRDTFLAKYGVARTCGAAQGYLSGNLVVGATFYNGNDLKKQDAFFLLLDNTGAILDTAFADAPGHQNMYAIIENGANPGLFQMVGDSEGSPIGVPSLCFAQVFEAAGALYSAPAVVDLQTPVSLRDMLEVDAGRLAIMGTLPDNPVTLGSTDVIVLTPEASVGIVYQNCALAATLSIPGMAFQWRYEGEDIPGANQGIYFPGRAGLYEVQIIDEKGCAGISDTFRVEGPQADFTIAQNGLEVVFTNTSEGANDYYWSFGDGVQGVSQANPVHTYAAPGIYIVTLIAANSCDLLDTVSYTVGVTSTENLADIQHFSLSPNPNSGFFSVELSGMPRGQIYFELYNAVGQLMLHEESIFQQGYLQKTFDVQALPSGVYSLQIHSGRTLKNVRIVKQ